MYKWYIHTYIQTYVRTHMTGRTGPHKRAQQAREGRTAEQHFLASKGLCIGFCDI